MTLLHLPSGLTVQRGTQSDSPEEAPVPAQATLGRHETQRTGGTFPTAWAWETLGFVLRSPGSREVLSGGGAMPDLKSDGNRGQEGDGAEEGDT